MNVRAGYVDRLAMRVADLEAEYQEMAQRVRDERQLRALAAGLIAVKQRLLAVRSSAAEADDELTRGLTLSLQRLLARFARARAEAA